MAAALPPGGGETDAVHRHATETFFEQHATEDGGDEGRERAEERSVRSRGVL
jgi:hypothetical protein